MRTTSMVLGIIGGVISILLGILIVFAGVMFTSDSFWDDSYGPFESYEGVASEPQPADEIDFVVTVFLSLGLCSAAAGVLGIVGACIVKKKNTAAGVMMIIAAALCLFSFGNLVSLILFIIGAVFALKRERQPMPYPPYPYYAYPQYPQYPQYPYYQYPPYPYPLQPPVQPPPVPALEDSQKPPQAPQQ